MKASLSIATMFVGSLIIIPSGAGAAECDVVDTNESSLECEFTAGTLAAAKRGYAANCSQPRVDCDRNGGGNWTCASYQIGSTAPRAEETSGNPDCEVEADNPAAALDTPVGDTDSDQQEGFESETEVCSFIGATRREARRGYAKHCSVPRADCDRLGDGRWMCSSAEIDDDVPVEPIPEPEPETPDINPQISWADSYSVGDQCYCDSTFDHNIGSILVETAEGPKSVREICDRIGVGPGSGGNPVYNDIQCGNGPANDAGDEQVCPGRVDLGADGCLALGPTWNLDEHFQASTDPDAPDSGPEARPFPIPAGSRYKPGDLIALHYDHAPDRDDAQAAAAGLTVSRHFGISPHVVSGTYGEGNQSSYNSASESVMHAVWGGEGVPGNWWNADARCSDVIGETINRWTTTLSEGGSVWVAEGGQSDFTAGIIREIKRLSPGIDTRSINIVQHSHGSAFNEANSNPENIAYIKQVANYVTIGNGNQGGNGTADLNERNPEFTQAALSSPETSAWEAAFNYLPPDCDTQSANCKLDFSDTVELLWILGIESDTFDNTDGFSEYFLR